MFNQLLKSFSLNALSEYFKICLNKAKRRKGEKGGAVFAESSEERVFVEPRAVKRSIFVFWQAHIALKTGVGGGGGGQNKQ